MPGEDIVDRVDGIVHEKTQVHEYGVDLTVPEGGVELRENARLSTLMER